MPALNADGGEAGVTQLLDGGPVPTALFCVNDLTALGAMRTLRAHGLRIPDDMAVVGYDDVNFASMLTTPLTSVRQPIAEMGRIAITLAERAAQDGHVDHVVLEPDLLLRSSTGAVR